ncbi:MAG: JmjC domain-containing protein [Micromonosporaceae bacterium]
MFDTLVEQWGGPTGFASSVGVQRLHGRLPDGVAESLITWDAIEELMRWHRLGPPHLKVVHTQGRKVNPVHYLDCDSDPRRASNPRVDPVRLRAVLAGGATLVIDGIEEMLPAIGETAAELSALCGELVQANLYATRGDTPAFQPHWDVIDVMAVQVEGEKHWDVYGPGTLHPISASVDPDNTRPVEPVWSGVLRAGDVLYVPRGWWHGVCGTGGSSIHLSYGFQRRTGLSYLSWLTEFARHAAPLREDLPRAGGPEELERHAKVLAECLHQLLREHPLSDYLDHHAAAVAPR